MPVEFRNDRIDELKILAMDHARDSVAAGVDAAYAAAYQNCPYDPDSDDDYHLRDTIEKKEITGTDSNFVGQVTAGDAALGVDYAAAVEFGSFHPVGPGQGRPKKEPYTLPAQPFMQPGYEAGRTAAEEHARRFTD